MSVDGTLRRPGAIERFVVDGFLVRGFEVAPSVMRALRPLFVRVAWHGAPAWRRSLLANAARLLGPTSSDAERKRLGLAILANMQAFIEEVIALKHADLDECARRVGRADGAEHLLAARAARRGAIIATAHMGSFESALAYLRRHEKVVHVVFARDALQRFEAHRARARARLGVHEAPVQGGLPIWMELRDALRRDEVVVIACDRTVQGQRASRVELLGAPARLPSGPVRLAVLADAPIVPVWCFRDDVNLIGLRAEPPLWPQLGEVAMQRALAESLGRVLREHPDQWLAVQPVWDDMSKEETNR